MYGSLALHDFQRIVGNTLQDLFGTFVTFYAYEDLGIVEGDRGDDLPCEGVRCAGPVRYARHSAPPHHKYCYMPGGGCATACVLVP